ncbi:MAG: RluA family pseudouridine synthase [Alphaproteobacteria bacterium]
MVNPFTLLVPSTAYGQRLDKVLAEIHPQESRSRWQQLITQGCVCQNGKVLDDAGMKLKAPQGGAELTLEVTMPTPVASGHMAEKIPLDIVFEDEHLIVINKPAGLTVHPGAGQRAGTLVNALLAHGEEEGGLSAIGGEERPGIVHRIDKDTTGLMVIAKTDAAHRALAQNFKDHTITRSYVALCRGVPVPAVGTINQHIGRHPTARTKMAVIPQKLHVANEGRTAITHYRTLKTFGQSAALVECRLETGRTHQIRVHMAFMHHPLIGDPLYGQHGNLKDAGEALNLHIRGTKRQMLHAQELGFDHPITGEALHFKVAPPTDFMALQAALAKGLDTARD